MEEEYDPKQPLSPALWTEQAFNRATGKGYFAIRAFYIPGSQNIRINLGELNRENPIIGDVINASDFHIIAASTRRTLPDGYSLQSVLENEARAFGEQGACAYLIFDNNIHYVPKQRATLR